MLREEHAQATSSFSQEDLSAPSKLTAHAFEDLPHAAGPGTAGGPCSWGRHYLQCPLTLPVCLRCIALFTCMPLLSSTGSVCFTLGCVCDMLRRACRCFGSASKSYSASGAGQDHLLHPEVGRGKPVSWRVLIHPGALILELPSSSFRLLHHSGPCRWDLAASHRQLPLLYCQWFQGQCHLCCMANDFKGCAICRLVSASCFWSCACL